MKSSNPNPTSDPSVLPRVDQWVRQDGPSFARQLGRRWVTPREIAGQLGSPLTPVDQVELACLELELPVAKLLSGRLFLVDQSRPAHGGSSVLQFEPTRAVQAFGLPFSDEQQPRKAA